MSDDRWKVLRAVFSLCVGLGILCQVTTAQTLLSRFGFNGDLINDVPSAPDGTFREGQDALTAAASTPTFGSGVNGAPEGAIFFDGVDDWVDASSLGFPNEAGGFLNGIVTFWVKKQNANVDVANNSWLAVTDGPSAGTAPFTAFNLRSNGAGSVNMTIRATDGDVLSYRHQEGSSFPTDWADGQWHHIGTVWATDDSGGLFSRVYVDGQPVGTSIQFNQLKAGGPSESQVDPWDNAVAIGARNQRNVMDQFYDGFIDDLRVYEHSYTQISDEAAFADAFILEIYNLNGRIPEPSSFTLSAFVLAKILMTARLRCNR